MNQKKLLKKSSAMLLAFCMIVSVALQHLPMISKASSESPTPEELGYTTRVDFEDFTKTSGTIAEKYEKGTTNTSYTGTYNGESLNATYLDVDVSFSSTDYSDWLKLGGTNGDTGVGVTIRSGKLMVRDLGGTNIAQYHDIAGELGLVDSINDKFNLKLGLKLETEIKYALWVNDVFLGEIVVTGATGNKLNIQTSTGYVTIKSAVDRRTPEELGYTTRVDFEDFIIDKGTVAEKYEKGTTDYFYRGTYSGESLNATYLDVDVSFSSTNYADWLMFGGNSATSGVGVTIRSGKLMVRDLGGTNLAQYHDIAGELGLVDSINDKFNLKLGLKQGTEIKYALWVNGVLLGEVVVTGATGKKLNIETSTGYVTIKSAVDRRTPEFLGYATRVTYEDFIRTGGTIAEKYEKGTTNYSYTGTYSGESLNAIYLDADVSFSSTNYSDWLKLGGEDGDTGVGVTIRSGKLMVRDLGGTNQAQYYDIAGALGLVDSINDEFNLKLGLKKGTETTSAIWVNDVCLGECTVTGATGKVLSVRTSTGYVTIKTPDETHTPEELGYERVTAQDFGLDNGTYYSGVVSEDHYTGSYGETTNLHMKYLDIDMSFEVISNNAYINFGGNNGWYGIRIFGQIEDGKEYLFIKDPGTNKAEKKYNLTEKGVSLYEPCNIKLATKCRENTTGGTDVIYTLWLNDQFIGRHTFISVPGLGNMLGIYANAGNVNIGTYTEKTLSPVSYDLSEGSYLVSGTKVSVYKDNALLEDVTSGTTITTPGDYTIKRTDNLTKYTQNISLYELGDVDCDGAFSVESDLAALQQILNGKTAEYKASTAAEYAADLDNDGNVGTKDLELMQAIKDGNTDIASVKTQYHVAALTYDYLGGDEVMPINGFFGPYKSENNYLTDEVFQLIKDSGVNLIAHSKNYLVAGGASSYAVDAIKMAEKYGLGYYLDDKRLNTEISSDGAPVAGAEPLDNTTLAKYLSVYSHYENFLGIDVVDEPAPNTLDDNENTRQLKFYDGMSKLLNGFVNNNAFINVLPNYASVFNRDLSAYTAYLEDVIESTEAKVLSFDHYPFELKTAGTGQGAHNATSYFASLSKVRNAAQTKNIPFWGYVQAGGDFRDEGNDGATDSDKQPTEAETYWNVNTMLAFGAKGIGWFPLLQPDDFTHVDKDNAAQDYDRNGLLGANATTEIESDVTKWTTPFYAYAKNINQHIAAIDEVLMKAKSTAIIATDGYAKSQTQGSVALATSTKKLKSVDANSETYGALVGCFDYRDTEAFYVVNYDVTKEQTITLTFDKTYDYRQIQNAKTTYGAGKTVTLTIPAGEAVLIVLEDRMVEVQDISEYRGTTADANKAPDAEPGYVFAGWYEVTPEDLGYSRVTIVDFGYSSKTYSAAESATSNRPKTYSGSLDMKYLDVDVTFSLEEGQKKDTSIRYGSTGGWTGIQISRVAGGLLICDAKNGKGETYTLAQLGLNNLDDEFNLKLAVDFGEGYTPGTSVQCDATYFLWINDVLIAKEAKLSQVAGTGNQMGIYTPKGSITVKLPVDQRTPEELGYSRVTISDFGYNDGTMDYTGKTNKYSTKPYTGTTLDKTYLDVDIKFNGTGTNNDKIIYGSADGNAGVSICVSTANGGVLRIRETMYGVNKEYLIKDIGLTSLNDKFNLKLAVDFGDNYNPEQTAQSNACEVTYTLWINNVLIDKDIQFTTLNTTSNSVVKGTGKKLAIHTQSGSIELSTPNIPELDTSEGRIPLASYKKSGMAYAKFVDENVLSVKAQITANTKANSEKADIRFVTTVDSLNYAEVGFMITPQGGATGKKASQTVYEKLYYVGKDSTTVDKTYLPTEFSSQSRYFNTYSYWNILNKHFGYTFTVTPYWRTLDGTTVYGQTAVKSVDMGITN